MKDSLWSVDLFRCESIVLKSYWVMVVMDHFTRRIEPADIDGVALCRMLNQAISGKPLPKLLSTNHDPLFRFHRWRANLRALEIEEIKTVPFVPCSHPFIERLIGTIRREYLDQALLPGLVLEPLRPSAQARSIRSLLQSHARSQRIVGDYSGRPRRPCFITSHRSAAVLLPSSLSRSVPHTSPRLISNSPWTGPTSLAASASREAVLCCDTALSNGAFARGEHLYEIAMYGTSRSAS